MKWLQERQTNQQFTTTKDFYEYFGFRNVLGIASAGWNAIAGPIYLAGVILPLDYNIEKLDRIKLMKDPELNRMADKIWDVAEYIKVSQVSSYDLLRFVKEDMTDMAILHLLTPFSKYNPLSVVLLDQINFTMVRETLSGIPFYSQRGLLSWVDSVAAASIVARQVRNVAMKVAHQSFPEYNWNKNFGFGTKDHKEAIEKYGLTRLHRRNLWEEQEGIRHESSNTSQ